LYTAATSITHYRGIDILSRNFNLGFGKLVLPFLKLLVVTVFITSFFAVTRLWSELNALSMLMLSVIAVASITLIIPISIIMSSSYDKSAKFQPNILPCIDMTQDLMEKKILRNQLISCSLIRCQVGSFYHMEAKAKLTLLQHIVNGIVYLLVNVKV